jgi:two-component system cell cycle sensor histidine kinase/response regulator CckA
MLAVDRAGCIVRANDALRRLAARRVDLSPGKPATQVFRATDRDSVAEVLAAALAGGAPPALPARLETSDSDPDHLIALSATPLAGTDGAAEGALLRMADLTPQRRLETQLAHSRKLQAVGQLAGGVAHDFNNLLTAILGAAELLLARAGLDPAMAEEVGQIRASAERGAALVRQLLAFSRQQTLQPRVVAINDAIRDISGLLRRLLGGRVQLALELEEPGRAVRVDPTQLDLVLVNLAVNARDAMPEGGRLVIRSGHITLFRQLSRGQEAIPPGSYVMIEVEDSGTGISPDVLPRIFDPFFTTKRATGGTGLGLSTVHGIVRQSDGFLAVDTELDHGTRFRLYLPAHDGPVEIAPSTPEQVPAAVPAPRRTVLLVDDEEPVRRVTERALAQRGFEVLCAESGEAALALLDARLAVGGAPPSLLLSDVVMPGLDGPALVAAVRARCPGLPAVLVSGYTEEVLRPSLTEPGMVFLSKPYTLKHLIAAVEATAAPPFAKQEEVSRAAASC